MGTSKARHVRPTELEHGERDQVLEAPELGAGLETRARDQIGELGAAAELRELKARILRGSRTDPARPAAPHCFDCYRRGVRDTFRGLVDYSRGWRAGVRRAND